MTSLVVTSRAAAVPPGPAGVGPALARSLVWSLTGAIPERQDTGGGISALGPQQQRDLAFFRSILENPSGDLETRARAAEHLMRMAVAPAIGVLERALRSGDDATVLAVVRAMSEISEPPPGLMTPAVDAVRTAPGPTVDQLSAVLAKYGEPALAAVSAIAVDRDLSTTERVNAVRALGSFPTRDSGDRLIGLADPRPAAPNEAEAEAIREAAFASLRRLAPADFGTDYAAWRAWWMQARDESQEKWTQEVVRQARDRIAELERQNQDLAQRYVDLLRDLYRTLEVSPGQLERLPADLTADTPAVRAFAMERIARLLRDSVLIPDPVRSQIVRAIDDPSPALRLKAMTLLDELDEPALAEAIARRLVNENNPEVVAGALALLARRPSPAALGSILAWVRDEQAGAAADEALWQLVTTTEIDPTQTAETHRVLRETFAAQTPPARAGVVRLLAFLGDESDLAHVEPYLDNDEPALRAAVAQGLAARGRRQPLLDRADDAAIYPSALAALTAGPYDLANFQRLVALAPPEGTADRWAEAVRGLGGQLPAERLLDADDALARVDYADSPLRTIILTRAAVRPADALPLDYRVNVLLRLTPLLLEEGEALRAFEILESANGAADDPRLTEIKFRAALLAGRYDAAAQVHADPRAWVTACAALVDQHLAGANRLCAEISRRFQDLPPDLEAEIEAVCARATPAVPVPGAGDLGNAP